MNNRPGISWGPDKPINLFRSSIGWLAVHYEPDGSDPVIIRVFHPSHIADYYAMVKLCGWYNYNTNRLCPMVKIALDGPITLKQQGDHK
jgi:hypothetical protein